MRQPAVVALAASALLTSLLAGCGGPLDDVEVPPMSEADLATCNPLIDSLPDTIHDLPRIVLDDDPRPFAGYGDPAIVVKCGVGTPPGWDTTKSCELADGVGYYIPDEQYDDQQADLTIFTAGYSPVVEIDVPASYRPNGNPDAMSSLAPLVKEYLELVEPCD